MRKHSAPFIRWQTSAAALVFLCLCAACSARPVATPTATALPPTSRFNTSVAPNVRATLPATWTPTWTPSPSQTPTPSRTPTPTATPSLSDLCASLDVDFPYEDGHVFETDETILILFGTTYRTWTSPLRAATPTPPPDGTAAVTIAAPAGLLTEPVTARLLLVHRESRENLGVEMPGGETMALQLPLHQLPGTGDYDWTVTLYVETLGELCARSGTFTVIEATSETAAPETAAPETTTEARADVIDADATHAATAEAAEAP